MSKRHRKPTTPSKKVTKTAVTRSESNPPITAGPVDTPPVPTPVVPQVLGR